MSVYFSGCEKDDAKIFNDHKLDDRYDSLSSNVNLEGIQQEFYYWYNAKRDSLSQLDSIKELSPFEFNVDWQSGI